mmetsp:Transcript_19998/g.43635  ORF Transcript_19998/g.43635 Transcript_19998/m.43635 type:complete len:241 (+) Transcript_19998:1292-2014(+)
MMELGDFGIDFFDGVVTDGGSGRLFFVLETIGRFFEQLETRAEGLLIANEGRFGSPQRLELGDFGLGGRILLGAGHARVDLGLECIAFRFEGIDFGVDGVDFGLVIGFGRTGNVWDWLGQVVEFFDGSFVPFAPVSSSSLLVASALIAAASSSSSSSASGVLLAARAITGTGVGCSTGVVTSTSGTIILRLGLPGHLGRLCLLSSSRRGGGGGFFVRHGSSVHPLFLTDSKLLLTDSLLD